MSNAESKPVLVAGGAGFIGSHLVDRLVADGKRVRVLDRSPVNSHARWIGRAQVEYLSGDFGDSSAIAVAVRDVEVAYHLVSSTIPATSNANPVFDVQSNLLGTLTFLNAASAAGIKKVVFVSSGGTVYGRAKSERSRETDPTDPICSYGITKLAIEKYLALFELQYRLRFIVLRVANLYGERQRPGPQGAIAAFMQKTLNGSPIEIWGDGSIVRDYVYIHDVVEALVRGAQYDGAFRVFNVGSGEGRSLNQVVDELRSVTGRTIARIHKESRPLDVPRSVLDIGLVKQELGWSPSTDFSSGLSTTWDWFQGHSDLSPR